MDEHRYRVDSTNFLEQTLHTDLILELTGEYSNSSESREVRLLRKFREEDNPFHHQANTPPEHSSACRETFEEGLDRNQNDDEFEYAKHILALTADRDFSSGHGHNETFRDELEELPLHEGSENITNRGDSLARVPAAPAEDVRTRWIRLRPPWPYRHTSKMLPLPPTVANSATNLTVPGAYVIQNRLEAEDLAPPQPDSIVMPSAPKFRHQRLLYLVIGFLLLFLIGILVGVIVNRSSRTIHPNRASNIQPEPVICNLDDIYTECKLEGATVFQSNVPACAFKSYLSLELDFLSLEFPTIPFPSAIISCEPENLALLTLAAHGEKSKNKFILNMIYFTMKGHTWIDTTNWLSSESVCSWYGITCQNEHITEIDLSYAGLNGTMPSILGQLDQLQVLNLQSNFLRSTIPEEMLQLRKLTDLNLSSNKFDDGPLPSGLSKLKSIETLKLSYSHLTGALTGDVFVGLTNLRVLELDWNSLTGTIPSAFLSLTNLSSITLNSNLMKRTIPSELAQLTKLETLNLGNNAFTGVLPSEIGLLTSLNGLIFSWNKLSGTIPKEVCALWDTAPLIEFGGEIVSEFVDYDFGEEEIRNFFGGLTCPSVDCCRTCPPAFHG